MNLRIGLVRWLFFILLLPFCPAPVWAEPPVPRAFPPGSLRSIEDLPVSRLRSQIEQLPGPAQSQALSRLQGFHFTVEDLASMQADSEGGIYYADSFQLEPVTPPSTSELVTSSIALPVSPFPDGLKFHSRLGAPNVIFLNFCGDSISGTAWNTSLNRTVIPAVAFSLDADFTTFNDAEQLAIKRIWQRVSEDYSPFDVDVTTERPSVFTDRTAHALITRNSDANGDLNPSSSGGGVSYVDVFTLATYANYRPSWIYFNNLAEDESYIGEATSHEVGHNFGLSHDGTTAGSEYYGGHGTRDTSWGTIMGTGYNRNVSQWCKGDYYQANNTQDDLAVLSGKLAYRADDHGDTFASATPLLIQYGTNISSTTPDTDPSNTNHANKGVLKRNTDVDVFSFVAASGPVSLAINPWIMTSTTTRGGNLDIQAELYSESGTLLLTDNSASTTYARIQTNLTEGVYYLLIRGVGTGDPFSSTPTGYTSYGSIGQYFIRGTVTASSFIPNPAALSVTVNQPAWGSVSSTGGVYTVGTELQLVATPAPYYQFAGWAGDISGANNPANIILQTNLSIQALFGEVLTTNHPTPLWWLAQAGYTGNFESAVDVAGANGTPVWQSYIAGLNPNDPESQLKLSLGSSPDGTNAVLNWLPVVPGRIYSIETTAILNGPFETLPGATNLTSGSFIITDSLAPTNSSATFYRIKVQKP